MDGDNQGQWQLRYAHFRLSLAHSEKLPFPYERVCVCVCVGGIAPRRSPQYVTQRRRERKMGFDQRKNAPNMDLRSVVASSDVNPTGGNWSRLVSSDGTWKR